MSILRQVVLYPRIKWVVLNIPKEQEATIYQKTKIIIDVISQIIHEQDTKNAMQDLHTIKRSIENDIAKLTNKMLRG